MHITAHALSCAKRPKPMPKPSSLHYIFSVSVYNDTTGSFAVHTTSLLCAGLGLKLFSKFVFMFWYRNDA